LTADRPAVDRVESSAPPPRRSAAFFIYDLRAGGAQRVLACLANALADAGRDITIVTLTGEEPPHFALSAAVRRIALDVHGRPPLPGALGRVAGFLRRWRAMRSVLKTSRPDVAVAFVGPTNLLLILAAIGLRTGCRIVISERNDPNIQRLRWPWDSLRRRLYRRADIVTANTTGAIESMRGYVPADRLRMIPNPVALPEAGRETAAPAVRRILNVARLHPQKGQGLLVEAYARIPATERAGWELHIVGAGALEAELRAAGRAFGLAEGLHWWGQVADTAPHYRGAEIFVLPSRHEGLPNALLEAMSFGCACLVSDASPGPLEYVEHARSGLVFRSGSVDALAEGLRLLIRDEALRARLGAAARQRVAALDPASVARRWEQVLWGEETIAESSS